MALAVKFLAMIMLLMLGCASGQAERHVNDDNTSNPQEKRQLRGARPCFPVTWKIKYRLEPWYPVVGGISTDPPYVTYEIDGDNCQTYHMTTTGVCSSDDSKCPIYRCPSGCRVAMLVDKDWQKVRLPTDDGMGTCTPNGHGAGNSWSLVEATWEFKGTKQCTCENGEGAKGSECPEHQGKKCVSCRDGYWLDAEACKPIDDRVMFCHDQGSSKCLPMQRLVGRGFDFTKTTIKDMERNALTYVIETGKTPRLEALGKKQYEVNDALSARPLFTIISKTHNVKFTSSRELRQRALDKLGVNGHYGKVKADAAAASERDLEQTLENDESVAEQEFGYKRYVIKLDKAKARPNIHIVSEFLNLPSKYEAGDNTNVLHFEAFIEKYGTHYVDTITVGVALSAKAKAAKCASSKCIHANMNAKVCADYEGGPIGAHGCAEAEREKKDCSKQDAQETSTWLEWRGGLKKEGCIGKCTSEQWERLAHASIDDMNLAVVGATISPLWELLQPDVVLMKSPETRKEIDEIGVMLRRAELQLALEDYVTKQASQKSQTNVFSKGVTCSSCPVLPVPILLLITHVAAVVVDSLSLV